MEIVKSYHAIAVHDSGRSPTFEEYERAIKYASRGTLAEKTLMKMLVTGPKDTERVLDWVRDYNIVPLDYPGYKRNVPHLLLYYISPPSKETVLEANQPHRYDYPYKAMAQADGESWNMPVNRSWVLQRDVMATVYLHAGQVHSYIKSELGMRGALNVSHISQNPSSFNEAFPELGGLACPLLLCAHHTQPRVTKTEFLEHKGEPVDWGDSHIFSTPFRATSVYEIDEEFKLTKIRREEDFTLKFTHMNRWKGRSVDNPEHDEKWHVTHDLEGNEID